MFQSQGKADLCGLRKFCIHLRRHKLNLLNVLSSGRQVCLVAIFLGCFVSSLLAQSCAEGLHFEISFTSNLSTRAVDGRVFLLLSKAGPSTPKPILADPDLFDSFPPLPNEPRFQVNDHADSQQIFGLDVDNLAPNATAIIDNCVMGYPLDRISQLPAGDYEIQGVLNIYETFHRSDGHVVKLPMDRGEGQQWNRKPGNFFSKPVKVHVDPSQKAAIRLQLTEVIPPIQPPPDTEYIKHVRIDSSLLTKFWGRPTQLGAIVLLPAGWKEHPHASYPIIIHHWHFTPEFAIPVGFRTSPLTPDLQGYSRTAAEYSYKFYQDWTSGRLPHVILVLIQHANPYFDDSYGVDSANVGPYGQAITQELIPYIEKTFRGMGQPWARALFGFSTGGWESAAQQIFYPDFFNGAWAYCPDPLDFRATQIVNIYDDENALWLQGPFSRMPRPGERRTDGSVATTMDRQVHRELVLGSHGRSGDQWNIWQAVFSPVGDDGYPKPIWDPWTGEIDHQVADYWRTHYDLRYILERDWKTLGTKLVGKLHFIVGTRDNFYLDNGVRLLQRYLETTSNPHYTAEFNYGPHAPHCYFGNPSVAVTIDQLRYPQRVLPQMVDWMEKSAPPGADLHSWKY